MVWTSVNDGLKVQPNFEIKPKFCLFKDPWKSEVTKRPFLLSARRWGELTRAGATPEGAGPAWPLPPQTRPQPHPNPNAERT